MQNAIRNTEQQLFNRITQSSQNATSSLEEEDDDDEEEEEKSDNTSLNASEFVHVVDIDVLPKMAFPSHHKIYSVEAPLAQSSLFGDANDRASMHRERYNMIRQIVERSHVLLSAIKDFHLTSIEALHGSVGNKYIFGMLTMRDSSQQMYLEDLNAHVKLDLSQTVRSSFAQMNETFFIK